MSRLGIFGKKDEIKKKALKDREKLVRGITVNKTGVRVVMKRAAHSQFVDVKNKMLERIFYAS
jgi:hypothetical protein